MLIDKKIMKIIALDTESTGLFHPDKHIPFLCQYSSVKWDTEHGLIGVSNKHVKPYYDTSDPDIDWKMIQKINGSSPEMLENVGDSVLDVYNSIMIDIVNSDLIVGHNLEYDMRLLCENFKMLGDPTLYDVFMYKQDSSLKFTPKFYECSFDTMKKTVDICKIPYPAKKKYDTGSKYKYPKLIELYQFLFSTPFNNGHDSLYDSIATMRCYLALTGGDHNRFMEEVTAYLS